MIKSVITFKRRPGLSVADFQDYWLNRHPKIVRQLNGLQRYVQNHPLPGGYASRELAVDGVAETWWPDTATMRKNAASPVWDRLIADEEQFIDRSTMQMLLVEEHVLKDEDAGENPYKFIELMHRRQDMPVEAYLAHWRDIHGPLGAAIPNVSRYVQNHPLMSAYTDGRQPAFDGFAMVWFASKDAMRSSPQSAEYKAAYADEANFIDHAGLDHVITREHEIPIQV